MGNIIYWLTKLNSQPSAFLANYPETANIFCVEIRNVKLTNIIEFWSEPVLGEPLVRCDAVNEIRSF